MHFYLEFRIRYIYQINTYKNKHRAVLPDPNFQAPFLTVAEDGKYGHGQKQLELQRSCRIRASTLITQIKTYSWWHNVMPHNLATYNNFLLLLTNRKRQVNTLSPPQPRRSNPYSNRGHVCRSPGQRIAEGLELSFCLLPAVLKIAVQHNSNKFPFLTDNITKC
jgi:hypothetical protein